MCCGLVSAVTMCISIFYIARSYNFRRQELLKGDYSKLPKQKPVYNLNTLWKASSWTGLQIAFVSYSFFAGSCKCQKYRGSIASYLLTLGSIWICAQGFSGYLCKLWPAFAICLMLHCCIVTLVLVALFITITTVLPAYGLLEWTFWWWMFHYFIWGTGPGYLIVMLVNKYIKTPIVATLVVRPLFSSWRRDHSSKPISYAKQS